MTVDNRPEARIAELIAAAREDSLSTYLDTHRLKALAVLAEAVLIAEQNLGKENIVTKRLRDAHAERIRAAAVGKAGIYTVQKPAPSSRKQSPHVTVNTACLGDINKVSIQFHPDYILISRTEPTS